MSMTNWQISSISDDDTRKLLTKYLKGEISLIALQEALEGYISINFDNAPDQRSIQNIRLNEEITLQVKKEHLCNMLRKYLHKDLSSVELSNWAAFIYMTPFFIPEGDTEEDRWIEGESITWEIIQRIASPNIFERIDPLVVEEYSRSLSCVQ